MLAWLEKFIIGLLEYIKRGHEPANDGLPSPDIEKQKIRAAIVVGHTKNAQGASFNGLEYRSEYYFNSAIAARMKKFGGEFRIEVGVFYRDGIGIEGVYREILKEKFDCAIELHFNAFNTKATGSETLCTTYENDKHFSKFIHESVCKCFNRQGKDNRGVKALAKGTRGSINVYSCPEVANCLVEPFFGDNAEETKLALEKINDYPKALLQGIRNWFDS